MVLGADLAAVEGLDLQEKAPFLAGFQRADAVRFNAALASMMKGKKSLGSRWDVKFTAGQAGMPAGRPQKGHKKIRLEAKAGEKKESAAQFIARASGL